MEELPLSKSASFRNQALRIPLCVGFQLRELRVHDGPDRASDGVEALRRSFVPCQQGVLRFFELSLKGSQRRKNLNERLPTAAPHMSNTHFELQHAYDFKVSKDTHVTNIREYQTRIT